MYPTFGYDHEEVVDKLAEGDDIVSMYPSDTPEEELVEEARRLLDAVLAEAKGFLASSRERIPAIERALGDMNAFIGD